MTIVFYLLFTLMCSIEMVHAQDGKKWDISFGKELTGPESAPAAIAVYDNVLHIGGHFTRLNSNTPYMLTTGHIASFSSLAWQGLDGGFNAPVKALCSGSDGMLYAAGSFTKQGMKSMNGIAKWNGMSWTDIPGLGLGSIESIIYADNQLFACGIFPSLGTSISPSIATLTNGIWQSLGKGLRKVPSPMAMNATAHIMHHANGKLYVGGEFDSAGTMPAKNIAYWDGKEWHSMGAGLNGIVNDIIVLKNGHVVVSSTIVNGSQRKCAPLMSWNGNTWSSLGLPPNCIAINALETDGLSVFVGGDFRLDSITNDCGIAVWDGTTFSSMGGGVRGIISSLLYEKGKLYCGGTFMRIADSLECRNIAAYDWNIQEHETEKETINITTFPNPIHNGMVSIRFSIDIPGEAELQFIAADGRILHSFAQGSYQKGVYEVQFNTQNIPSGHYQCSLVHRGSVTTTPMHIMH